MLSRSIYLIEAHPLLQLATKEFINKLDGFAISGIAPSGREALVRIPELAPTLVITDISTADMDGIDVVSELHHVVPAIPVMVLSSHQGSYYVERMLSAGGRGYVVKGYPEQIELAIRHILDGEIYLCPRSTKEKTTSSAATAFSFYTAGEEEKQQQYLEQANRNIAKAKENIVQQEVLILRLKTANQDTTQAQEMLALFKTALQYMQHHREQILAALAAVRNH